MSTWAYKTNKKHEAFYCVITMARNDVQIKAVNSVTCVMAKLWPAHNAAILPFTILNNRSLLSCTFYCTPHRCTAIISNGISISDLNALLPVHCTVAHILRDNINIIQAQTLARTTYIHTYIQCKHTHTRINIVTHARDTHIHPYA